jgi:hypothetical protein
MLNKLEQFGKDNMFKSLVGLSERLADAFPGHKTKVVWMDGFGPMTVRKVRMTVQLNDEPGEGDLTLEMASDPASNKFVAINDKTS